MKKEFPFRPTTLEEREKFYDKEFSIKKAKSWFKGRKFPQICAIDAGGDTGIIKNKKLKGHMLYFPFKELKKKIKKYIPEDVYYDRSTYENPKRVLKSLNFKKFVSQELVFDIDADNVECNCGEEKICNSCIKKAYSWALRLKKDLGKKEGFKKIKIVYSGRGFHVYVFDKRAHLLDIKERDPLVKKFKKYPIDEWVSRGYIRLIRMPYSLNALVSRIAIPISGKGFNKIKTIPKFLKN